MANKNFLSTIKSGSSSKHFEANSQYLEECQPAPSFIPKAASKDLSQLDPDHSQSEQANNRLTAKRIRINHLLDSASEAKKTGNINSAIEYYCAALAIDEHSPELWNDLGNLNRRANQLQEAIECYRKALTLKADSAPTLHNIGIALEDSGRQDRAMTCFQEALQIDPGLWRARKRLGLIQLKSNETEAALNSFQILINQRPTESSGYYLCGLAYFQLKKYKQAIRYYKESIRIAPNIAEVHGWLGDALMRLGLPSEALNCYKRAINLGSKDSTINLQRAIAHELTNDVSSSLAIYQELLRLPQFPPSTPALFALALLKAGDYCQAFETISTRSCDHPSLFNQLKNIEVSHWRWDGTPLSNPDQTIAIIGDHDPDKSLFALGGLNGLDPGLAEVIICLPNNLVKLAQLSDLAYNITSWDELPTHGCQTRISILDALAISQRRKPGNRIRLNPDAKRQKYLQKKLGIPRAEFTCINIDLFNHSLSSSEAAKLAQIAGGKEFEVVFLPSLQGANPQSDTSQTDITGKHLNTHNLSEPSYCAHILSCSCFAITTDKLIAQIAGLTNTRCFLLLPEDDRDWRWSCDQQNRSYWHQKTSVYRFNPGDLKTPHDLLEYFNKIVSAE